MTRKQGLPQAARALLDQIAERMDKRDRWELGDCDFADARDALEAALKEDVAAPFDLSDRDRWAWRIGYAAGVEAAATVCETNRCPSRAAEIRSLTASTKEDAS